MREPRIVHLCRVGWPRLGGMEVAVHGLAREQQRRGLQVRVVTLDRLARGEERLTDGAHEGVRYQRLRGWGTRRYPFAHGLREALADADVVHIHGVDGLADQVVRRVKGPHIGLSTHGGYFHTPRQARLKQLWLRTITRSTLQRLDALWFTSEADAQRFSAAGVRGEVLGNGVDVDRFVTARQPQAGRWAMLGRLEPHKGLADLARWLPELPVTLHLYGPVIDAAHLCEVQRELTRRGAADKLVVHGRLPEDALRAELAQCELLVAPSRSEGFGLAVVEAMGGGIPVVVSAGTALEERIARGGGWALDLRRDDAGSRLAALVGADHSQVAVQAKRAAQEHSWQAVGERWQRAYEELLCSD